ncbi:MAG: endosialidase [Lachnospiraceae bacterium]|nr:endosialidase [Lachnospiraceae bacterium]
MESKDLIHGNENGTLDFGNNELTVKAKVPEYEFRGDIYKVKTFCEITKLERNGMFVYESVPGTCVKEFLTGEDGLSFVVDGKEDAQITLELEDDTEYRIFIDGANAGRMKTNLSGKLTISVELGSKPVDVRIAK